MPEVRILIADDHELLRHGLRTILTAHPGWTVVGEAADGRSAVALTRELKPDVVILDIAMPELNGLEATREILREAAGTEVCILTLHDSEQLAREVLQAGARGYVLKTDASQDVITAVEALARHKPFFTTKVASMVLSGYLSAGAEGKAGSAVELVDLTPRERQVLQLLAEGKSNKEVANSLGISVKTAETHRANIMNKLGFHSLSELVRYAVRNHLTVA